MLEWLRRRAENVAVFLLASMFAAFVLQVVFRYLLNMPSGWASELTVTTWLWLVLWGAAFVLREEDEIRFDLVIGIARKRARAMMGLVVAVALLVAYGYSLPAVYDFVSFMKVQSTTYLKIRYDYLFSIFVLFVVAILARYLVIALSAIRDIFSQPLKKGETK